MSFLDKVKGFFHHVKVEASAAFVAVFGQQAAQKFADASHAIFQSELGKIALTTVSEIEQANPALPGHEKAALARTNILNAAKSIGHDVSTDMVNLLIETAVTAIRGHVTALPITPSI